MISVPRPLRKLLLLVAGIAACASPVMAEWETVRHNGQDYVTVCSMKSFYGFQTMKNTGRFLELENKAAKMKLTIRGQEVFMNYVMFVFSF